MKKLVMVEEWVREKPQKVCHHVEEQNCYDVMKTKYVPQKVSRFDLFKTRHVDCYTFIMNHKGH